MSLTDVGLQFKLTGADDFQSKMNSLKGSFDSFSNATAKGIDVSPQLQKMTSQFNAMHKGVKGALALTEGAILAFLAGSAVKGLANWITGGQRGIDIDKMKDFIRFKKGDEAYIKAVGDKIKELSQQRPLDSLDSWKAQEQIISMTGPNNPQLAARATEGAANLGYVLGGPEGSSNRAMDFARTIIESYGTKMGPEEKTALLEKNVALLKYITDTTQTKGHDIEGVARQIASPYAAAGKSIEEMYAVAGILGGAMGEPGGEVAKNIMSKQGEGYGKFMAEADKQDYLVRLRKRFPWIKSEGDLPEDVKHAINKSKSRAEMSYAAEGGRLAAQGNLPQVMSNILAANERLKKAFPIMGKDPTGVMAQAFGETAIKGFNAYAEAAASGRLNRMIQEGRALNPSRVTPEINAAQQSLGGKAETLDQAISGLSKEFRRIFEPAAIGIIDEAKKTFIGMRSQLDALNKEGGLSKAMGEAVAAAIGGFKNAFFGTEEAPKTFQEITTEFAQSLTGGGWAESAQKLGTAIGEFATAASKFAELIGMLYAPIASYKRAKKWIESWHNQHDPKTASASEQIAGILGELGIANLARRARGWKTGLLTYLFGGFDKEPWQTFGNMATGAELGGRFLGPEGVFPGAVAGWAAHKASKFNPIPSPFMDWANDMAAQIWRGQNPIDNGGGGTAKPEVRNEVEATIDEAKLTDWLTIKIKTILKDLGSQKKDDSWQNSQDWGAMGTGGP